MPTRQDILDAIRKAAKENGGKPLGSARFEKETGINSYEWGRYWARFGDAQKEAGLVPNQLQGAYAEDFLIKKIIDLTRKLGKFPTYREIQVEKNNDSELPDKQVFQRLGAKQQLVIKIAEYCKDKEGFGDIIELCDPILKKSNEEKDIGGLDVESGEVYLFKSGRYYKIGKTNDTVRRGSELRIQLPEKCILIHSIETDDPSDVEVYWHKRFDAKRMQGEWFDLNSAEVKAFKCWRRII